MNNSINCILILLRSFIEREDGQDLVEYGLVVALIAFGAILGLQELGGTASLIYSAINSTLKSVS
jgi:pilus assembly protein Flp/PilA